MQDWLKWSILGLGLLQGLVGYVQFRRKQSPGRADLVVGGLLTLVVAVQLVVAAVVLSGPKTIGEPVTLFGYLVAMLIVPAAALWWGRLDESRWGSLVVAISGLAMAVLAVRLGQIWATR